MAVSLSTFLLVLDRPSWCCSPRSSQEPPSPQIWVTFAVGGRAVACCLRQSLVVIVVIMVIFAVSDCFLVWGTRLPQ